MLKTDYKYKYLESVFYRIENEIDIYVEDEKKDREFYQTLMSRLIEGVCKINRIYNLGSKSEVIEACKGSRMSKRKKIFIVDADLDLINDSNPKDIKRLFVLNSYCIENFLIDYKGAMETLYLFDGETSHKNIRRRFKLDNWFRNYVKLNDLFINYAIMREKGIPYAITSFGSILIQNKICKIDKRKLNLIVNQQQRTILQHMSKVDYSQLFDSKAKVFNPLDENTIMRIVSGKDFLIKMLQLYMGGFCKIIRNQKLKMHLAKFCDLNRLNDLKSAIIKL